MTTSRRAAAAAAAAAATEETGGGYRVRKGGTAKFKKGSKVLVPHTDQVRLLAG